MATARCEVRVVDTSDGSDEAIVGYQKVENDVVFEWSEAEFFLEVNVT
jgi:hypothetical protein